MENNQEFAEENRKRREQKIIGVLAIITGIIIGLAGILGPLVLKRIDYYTSISAIYQTQGQDLINLLIIMPLLLVAGILILLNKRVGLYLLSLTPIFLMYYGLSYGIGQEWNFSGYTGNVEKFFGIYLWSIIAGLIFLIYTISEISAEDAPEFSRKKIKGIVIAGSIFMGLFALMWIKEIFQVISIGDLDGNAYSDNPNVFWVVRYLDLGFSIPLGFISFYILSIRPKRAYPLLLNTFGFFANMALAVNAMAWIMFFNHDPALQSIGLALFGILGAISLYGTYVLFKRK